MNRHRIEIEFNASATDAERFHRIMSARSVMYVRYGITDVEVCMDPVVDTTTHLCNGSLFCHGCYPILRGKTHEERQELIANGAIWRGNDALPPQNDAPT